MKETLSRELNKSAPDIPKLTKIIIEGKQIKLLWVVRGYEEIGLFKADKEGNNIFHFLAKKGILSVVCPSIQKDIESICKRESITTQDAISLAHAANKNGMRPADCVIKRNDKLAMKELWTLCELGVDIRPYVHRALDYNKDLLVDMARLGDIKILESIMFSAFSKGLINENMVNQTIEQLSLYPNVAREISFFEELRKYFNNPQIHQTKALKDHQKVSLQQNEQQQLLENKIDTETKLIERSEQEQYLDQKQITSEVDRKLNENQNSEIDIRPQVSQLQNKKQVVLDIEEYKDYVIKFLRDNKGSKKIAAEYLGKEYTDLHLIISIFTHLGEDKSDTMLRKAIAGTDGNIMSTYEFLGAYTDTLKIEDLSARNESNKTDAYGIACICDNKKIVDLLLKKGFKLGFYNKDTKSIFETLILKSSNSSKFDVLEYLLNEQKYIPLDWHFMLLQATKYANVKVFMEYAKAQVPVVDILTNKKGDIIESGEYSIYNKMLYSLSQLSSIEKLKNMEKPEHRNKEVAVLAKIHKLCDCLKVILDADKVFFVKEYDHPARKKSEKLLNKLHKKMKELSDAPDVDSKNATTKLIDLFTALKQHGQCISEDQVEYSETTVVSHFSALSDIGYDYKVIGEDYNNEKTINI